MEVFLNSRFIVIETIIFLILFGSLLGTYIVDIYLWYRKIMGIITPRKNLKKESSGKKKIVSPSIPEQTSPIVGRNEEIHENIPPDATGEAQSQDEPISSIDEPEESQGIPPEHRERIVELLAHIKTRLARHDYSDARILIIEGLSIDKTHKELNILLAGLYEKDADYKKSEIIYKDLAQIYPEDEEVLEKLAYNLMMLHKYDIAYEVQKKLVDLYPNEDNLYTIVGLAWELQRIEDTLMYGKDYLRQFPKNPEILWIKAQAEIENGQRADAIEDLQKLKNLAPYNTELSELLMKLRAEEELSNNNTDY